MITPVNVVKDVAKLLSKDQRNHAKKYRTACTQLVEAGASTAPLVMASNSKDTSAALLRTESKSKAGEEFVRALYCGGTER